MCSTLGISVMSVDGSTAMCSGSTVVLLGLPLVCLEELVEWSFMSTFKTSTLLIKRRLASKRKISYSPTGMKSSGHRHQDKGQVKMCIREAFP